MALKKIEEYRVKAKKRHVEICSTTHFENRVKSDNEFDAKLNKKMGYLNISNMLY